MSFLPKKSVFSCNVACYSRFKSQAELDTHKETCRKKDKVVPVVEIAQNKTPIKETCSIEKKCNQSRGSIKCPLCKECLITYVALRCHLSNVCNVELKPVQKEMFRSMDGKLYIVCVCVFKMAFALHSV